MSLRRVVLPALLLLGPGCEAEVETVPEGALALVGGEALGPEDVEEVQAQLGAYAQARFRGPHGQRLLIDSVIDAELLSQEAIDAGFENDPRVGWAVIEEMAAIQLAAELERRVPRAEIAADTEALHAYYDAHLDDFRTVERRRLEGVRFDKLEEAEAALARCRAGEAELSEFGEVVTTPITARDDARYPGFHVLLFDPELKEGDWLAHPAVTERKIVVGRVFEIQAAEPREFEDPAVQEQLVNAVRAERIEPVRAQYLAELAERYPASEP